MDLQHAEETVMGVLKNGIDKNHGNVKEEMK